MTQMTKDFTMRHDENYVELHNTTEIIIIIKWDVLLLEKIFLVTSSTGQESPIDGM